MKTIISEVKKTDWINADWSKLRGTCIAYVGSADVDRLVGYCPLYRAVFTIINIMIL